MNSETYAEKQASVKYNHGQDLQDIKEACKEPARTIPYGVVICGVKFNVVLQDNPPNKLNSGDLYMGRCETSKATITLDKGLSDDMLKQTLIHEYLHAVLDIYGIEHNEPIIHVLSNELFRNGFRV